MLAYVTNISFSCLLDIVTFSQISYIEIGGMRIFPSYKKFQQNISYVILRCIGAVMMWLTNVSIRDYIVDYIREIRLYQDIIKEATNGQKVERILDIGCGSCCWSGAMALLFPDATVVSFDPSKEALATGQEILTQWKCNNTCFYNVDLKAFIDTIWHGEKYDLILSNGLLMYLDRDEYFRVLSQLMDKNGKAFLLHTHSFGYIFTRAIKWLLRFDLMRFYYYGVKGLIVEPFNIYTRHKKDGDTFLTRKHIDHFARKHGFKLSTYNIDSIQGYKSKVLGVVPYVNSYLVTFDEMRQTNVAEAA